MNSTQLATAQAVAESISTETVKTPKAEFRLSNDQDKAAKRIVNFMLDPDQDHLILQGYAGSGKSTLLRYILDSMPRINQLALIVGEEKDKATQTSVYLTATTNKAAGALMQTTGQGACTVHRQLGLVLQRNPENGRQHLVPMQPDRTFKNDLFIIDEAYMASPDVLSFIQQMTSGSKILWVGDPAQLLPVGCAYTPLSRLGHEVVALREIVRQQSDNPIIEMTALCRNAVETGNFFKFQPDGYYISHVSRKKFAKKMLKDFANQQSAGAVKTLTWTNKGAIAWNAHVKQSISGTTQISVGDYVVCNSAIRTKTAKLNTDQTVQVTAMQEKKEFGVDGHEFELDDKHRVFMPNNPEDKHALLKMLSNETDTKSIAKRITIEDSWADLRDEYACTVNKSQGSTYNTVYIDLNDIARCRDPNQLARLLYVATSRAAERIIFTGDLA